MQLRNSAERYGAIPQTLHWAIAVLVMVAWVLGTVELPRGPARATGEFLHMSAGLAVLGLLVVRLIWRLADPPPPLEPTALGRWADYAGRVVHWLLYALLAAVIAAGITTQFAEGHALPVFGIFDVASPWARDHDLAETVEDAHEALANALLIVAGLHAAAALVHHWWLRDRTLLRMLPESEH